MRKNRKMQSKDRINFCELALNEDELHSVEEQYNVPVKENNIVRLVDKYYEHKDLRQLHSVNKKTYILLNIFLGFIGAHRYYEHRYVLGVIYTLLSVTLLSVPLSFIDLLIVLPIKSDNENKITI